MTNSVLMKHTCPHCGRNFERPLYLDYLGWHTACPFCEGSFDVDPDPESPGEKLRAAKKKAADLGNNISYNAGYVAGYADALAEVYGARYYLIKSGDPALDDCAVHAWLTKAEATAHLAAGYSLTH